MSDLDLDALRKIAEAATRGPWWTGQHSLGARKIDVMADGGWYMPKTEADAAHIATFDPPTVLALIAKAREAEDFVGQIAAYHQSEAYFSAQAIMERDNAALAEIDTLTADLATARTQLATAREALIRISDYMNKHTMTGTVAREALSQLPEAPK